MVHLGFLKGTAQAHVSATQSGYFPAVALLGFLGYRPTVVHCMFLENLPCSGALWVSEELPGLVGVCVRYLHGSGDAPLC